MKIKEFIDSRRSFDENIVDICLVDSSLPEYTNHKHFVGYVDDENKFIKLDENKNDFVVTGYNSCGADIIETGEMRYFLSGFYSSKNKDKYETN